jgi:hypothetical protein
MFCFEHLHVVGEDNMKQTAPQTIANQCYNLKSVLKFLLAQKKFREHSVSIVQAISHFEEIARNYKDKVKVARRENLNQKTQEARNKWFIQKEIEQMEHNILEKMLQYKDL